jgi:hypothetical protein
MIEQKLRNFEIDDDDDSLVDAIIHTWDQGWFQILQSVFQEWIFQLKWIIEYYKESFIH